MPKDQIPYPLQQGRRLANQGQRQLPAQSQVRCACGLQPNREYLEAELESAMKLHLFAQVLNSGPSAFRLVHPFHALLREVDHAVIQSWYLRLKLPSEQLRSWILSCSRLADSETARTRGLCIAWIVPRGAILQQSEFPGDESFRCGMPPACFRQPLHCLQTLQALGQI
ncbi:unannotated protein [freshwater metagenome]|uniref:Unannotated protein n=1 Tax=freshwater metagenome TaxID=449393 RepID=A0A6J6MFJ7_9ZZZZ